VQQSSFSIVVSKTNLLFLQQVLIQSWRKARVEENNHKAVDQVATQPYLTKPLLAGHQTFSGEWQTSGKQPRRMQWTKKTKTNWQV